MSLKGTQKQQSVLDAGLSTGAHDRKNLDMVDTQPLSVVTDAYRHPCSSWRGTKREIPLASQAPVNIPKGQKKESRARVPPTL